MSFSFEKVLPLGITEYLQNRKSLQKLAGLKRRKIDLPNHIQKQSNRKKGNGTVLGKLL